MTTITVETTDYPRVTVRLNDALVDLDQPLRIMAGGKQRFASVPVRTMGTIFKTLGKREFVRVDTHGD